MRNVLNDLLFETEGFFCNTTHINTNFIRLKHVTSSEETVATIVKYFSIYIRQISCSFHTTHFKKLVQCSYGHSCLSHKLPLDALVIMQQSQILGDFSNYLFYFHQLLDDIISFSDSN